MTPRALYCACFVATTNSGANYWTITLAILTPGGGSVDQGAIDTSGMSANAWKTLTLSSFVTSPWASATYSAARISIAKTGTPGNLYLNPALFVV